MKRNTIIAPPPNVPAGPDEEVDWSRFRSYLADLAPDSLWDVYRHVDADRFPRRKEAIEREMTRRGLFFVSPFAEWEQKARLVHLNLIVFALFAAVLHGIPAISGVFNRASVALNNGAAVLSPTGQAVSVVSGLTTRETQLLTTLCNVSGLIAASLWLVSLALLPWLLKRRRALHRDVLLGAWGALAIGGGFLWLSRW